MFLRFPRADQLTSSSLEQLAIVVCLRWLTAGPLCVAAGLTVLLLFPDLEEHFDAWYFTVGGAFLLFVVRDLLLVRRTAKSWPEEKFSSTRVLNMLPFLAIPLVPVILLDPDMRSAGATIKWTLDMFWALSCFAVLFYLVYFFLLLVVARLPRPLSLLGFGVTLVCAIDGYGRVGDRLQHEKPKKDDTHSSESLRPEETVRWTLAPPSPIPPEPRI